MQGPQSKIANNLAASGWVDKVTLIVKIQQNGSNRILQFKNFLGLYTWTSVQLATNNNMSNPPTEATMLTKKYNRGMTRYNLWTLFYVIKTIGLQVASCWSFAGFTKTHFLKKAQPTRIFYLNEQLGSLVVDLAHQLSFCLDSPVL